MITQICLVGAEIFNKAHNSHKQVEPKTDDLYRQIGQLKAENDFLSESSVSKPKAAKANG